MASEAWKKAANAEVRRLAASGVEFDSDDLLATVGHPDPLHAANSSNSAIGSIFSQASKAGTIKMVGTKTSKQPHRKKGLVRVWKGCMITNNRLSASRLKTFMNCQLQAKFKYVDKLPDDRQNAAATYGSCVHHALESFNNTNDLDGAIAEFLDVWDNPDKVGSVPTEWPRGSSYGGYRSRGIEMLKAYHEQQQWQSREILATEHPFLVPLGEFELTGFVDLLEIRQGKTGDPELRIVDFKSSKKKPSSNNLAYDVQFTAYAYASEQAEFWLGNGPDFPPMENGDVLWDKYKDVERHPIWYHLETQQELECGVRGDLDYMRLYRCATEIAKAVEFDVFVPDISGDSCHFCPFKEPCGLPIPKESYNAN